jgi:hypothetical protein
VVIVTWLLSTVAAFVRTATPFYLGYATPSLTIGFNLACTFYFLAVKHGKLYTLIVTAAQAFNTHRFFKFAHCDSCHQNRRVGECLSLVLSFVFNVCPSVVAMLSRHRRVACVASSGSRAARCRSHGGHLCTVGAAGRVAIHVHRHVNRGHVHASGYFDRFSQGICYVYVCLCFV